MDASSSRMLLMLLIVLAVVAGAAMPATAEVMFGAAVKGGLDAATLSKEFRVARYGFSGGVSGGLQRPFTGGFSLGGQLDLLYTTRGADVIVDDVLQGRFRQHYFDVVLAARPELQLGRVSGYLLAGGSLNLLVNAKSENATGMSMDITSDLRRSDLSLVVAAGVALRLAPRSKRAFGLGTMFLEARHDHGLIDIDPMDGGFKNRTTSFMLGISFVVGKSASGETTTAAE
jgi:hypothetical protein